ncbi:PLP-dependent aminotransferase family protein [Pararhizobium sp. IMCC21322]|uniref:MocR-like pyridoxine biosynthesis transcription factor PdxR n=1 Tax=Pararhizobium sp. IMCC21322 TaxID=3067903 RepID=UPI002741F740|nr:PLP-dependent aminotransferase family protein [Pararhizobium sp. IMCC21322]
MSLRNQICEMLSDAISKNNIVHNEPLPSCRALSKQLGVSRNTVFAAYVRLIDSGLILSRNRSGYFVNPETVTRVRQSEGDKTKVHTPLKLDLKLDGADILPSELRKVEHPDDWNTYPYPFIYNQMDPRLFPLQEWRECMRLALNSKGLADWSGDSGGADSANLVKQVQQRLLTYRGLDAGEDEILITSGAQNAIFCLATLFGRKNRVVALEDPCYPEARNAFTLAGCKIVNVPVDEFGMRIEDMPDDCGLVYTTPSHQFPTTVTMSEERRLQLSQMAAEKGFVICEDDYEAEMNFVTERALPIRSLDRSGNVVYIGSLSKSLAPGLRLGYMVAHPDIVKEAKAVRRAMMRHPPTLLQEAMALFLGLGYQDVHLRRLHRRYKIRWEEMRRALQAHLPDLHIQASQGGTCFWIVGPPTLDVNRLAEQLEKKGVLIDVGSVFFSDPEKGRGMFRLGFAAIPKKAIAPGVQIISEEITQILS